MVPTWELRDTANEQRRWRSDHHEVVTSKSPALSRKELMISFVYMSTQGRYEKIDDRHLDFFFYDGQLEPIHLGTCCDLKLLVLFKNVEDPSKAI